VAAWFKASAQRERIWGRCRPAHRPGAEHRLFRRPVARTSVNASPAARHLLDHGAGLAPRLPLLATFRLFDKQLAHRLMRAKRLSAGRGGGTAWPGAMWCHLGQSRTTSTTGGQPVRACISMVPRALPAPHELCSFRILLRQLGRPWPPFDGGRGRMCEYNHTSRTVPRLVRQVRPQGLRTLPLELLQTGCAEGLPRAYTNPGDGWGGLGEGDEEVHGTCSAFSTSTRVEHTSRSASTLTRPEAPAGAKRVCEPVKQFHSLPAPWGETG